MDAFNVYNTSEPQYFFYVDNLTNILGEDNPEKISFYIL